MVSDNPKKSKTEKHLENNELSQIKRAEAENDKDEPEAMDEYEEENTYEEYQEYSYYENEEEYEHFGDEFF